MIVLYILLALLAFGFLILVHELGHFTFAKLFKVSITEFSIGMGPKIVSKKGKDGVQYSLRLFPIGGYVAMDGENEESDSPNSFDKKPPYQRFIIALAGAVMNITIAVLIVFFITIFTPYYGTTTIHSFDEANITSYQGLLVGDEIVKIDETKVTTLEELNYAIMLNGNKPVDVSVIRENETLIIESVRFPTFNSDGLEFGKMNFNVWGEERTIKTILKNTFHTSISTVKMIWDSLTGLISGRFGLNQVSGPVGVTGAMVEVAKNGPRNFFYMIAVISMNLGVFNLLPIPALDGGTLLFTGVEMIFKKRIPKRIEDTLKFVFFVLLLLFIVFISIKDVVSLIF